MADTTKPSKQMVSEAPKRKRIATPSPISEEDAAAVEEYKK